MKKSYLATQFWMYMSDKYQLYLFFKNNKKSNTILVARQSYKQKIFSRVWDFFRSKKFSLQIIVFLKFKKNQFENSNYKRYFALFRL